MQTIIVYNENEVKEQREFQNLKSEDKIWIDLADPTDNDLESFVELFPSRSKCGRTSKKQVQETSDKTS